MVLQKPIKHSALSSDGGFLETAVTGVTNLSTGSIVYGDASEIVTELSAGSEGDALKISSGVPAWATGSAGASGWEFVEEFTLSTTQALFLETLSTPMVLEDYNMLLQWWIKNESISTNMQMKFDDKSVYLDGQTSVAGLTVSGNVEIPADSWCIGSCVYYGNPLDTDYTMGFLDCTHGTTSSGNLSGTPYRASFRLSSATTQIEEIRFIPTLGNQYAGNFFRVYRMATS